MVKCNKIRSIDPANCFCGKPLRFPYERMTGECTKCEDAREAETALMIACDPRMRK